MNNTWVDIVGYEGIYKVSKDGQVMNVRKNKTIKPLLNIYGYYSVRLHKDGNRRTAFVHRLIAQAFIPNPDNKSEVNHIDGNKLNNDISNLEWVSHRENIIHSVDILNHQKRAVRCIETGIVYESIKAAALAVNGHKTGIAHASNGKIKTYKGYHWEKINTYRKKRPNSHPVIFNSRKGRVLQLLKGRIIKVWDSQSDICKATNFKQPMLSQALNGVCKTAYGYEWLYETKTNR